MLTPDPMYFPGFVFVEPGVPAAILLVDADPSPSTCIHVQSLPQAQIETQTQTHCGLINRTGEYNCFLNVIVQSLWHCKPFRKALLQCQETTVDSQGHGEVATALLELFDALGRDGTQLVDPTSLRRALAALPGDAFGIGKMADAAEVHTLTRTFTPASLFVCS